MSVEGRKQHAVKSILEVVVVSKLQIAASKEERGRERESNTGSGTGG